MAKADMEELHISTLRLEPHRIHLPPDSEYRDPPEGILLWRVFADDEQLTDDTLPFSPIDQALELHTNLQFPVWGYGGGYVSVRRIGEYVIWTKLLDSDNDDLIWGDEPLEERIIIFEGNTYGATINQAPSEVVFSWRKSQLNETLPELTIVDLRNILTFPNPELALYRIPKREHDNLGAMVLRRVSRAVHEELDAVCVSEPPAHYTELRIGFDELPDFYESVWHIGKTEQGVAIRFVEHPYFPLWLCGAAFDKALGSEPFLQT